MHPEIPITPINSRFRDFLFRNKTNKIILWTSCILILLQFSIFKYFYPFASYIHGDSFSYLNAAEQNLNLNTYLIGYSKFLRLFSIFSGSDLVLVLFQYIFIHAATFLLVYSIFYIYKVRKAIMYSVLCIAVINPLYLHLANLVSSDAIFLGLSMCWLATLLWIVHSPTKTLFIIHVVLIAIAFTVRYNALIYPFISIGAILFTKLRPMVKILVCAAILVTCGGFAFHTAYLYKQLTGSWQYSPFSGWQWANNAMYSYRYVNEKDRVAVPPKYQKLDKDVCAYFDSTRNWLKYPQELLKASTVYMWTPTSPLYIYRNRLYASDSTATELKKWASMGPLYGGYGKYIIRTHFKEYLIYYVWPNANKYFAPPVEFLEFYNSGKDTVNTVAARWFNYATNKMTTHVISKQVTMLNFYSILSGSVNLIMLMEIIILLSAILRKGYSGDKKICIFPMLLWSMNAGFTIIASSAALRFQSFPLMVTTIFSIVFFGIIWEKFIKESSNKVVDQKLESLVIQ